MRGKKGISPIISTILLVSLVIILAAIVFLWARGFVKEKIEKFDKAIELTCQDVKFEAIYSSTTNKLSVVNRANVPIYKINVLLDKGKSSTKETFDVELGIGETKSVDLVGTGATNIIVIPILLGKSGDKNKEFTCDKSLGVEAEIK